MITLRLPLALPPHSKDPTLYAIGLWNFAQIYTTFESLWQALRCNVAFHGRSSNMHDFLSNLLPKGLERSERLHRDLLALDESIPNGPKPVRLRRTLSKTDEFKQHICNAVVRKPHVLVAYAWIMYMAIFSGGRWIRAELLSAGENFWTSKVNHDGSMSDIGKERTEENKSVLRQLPGLLFLSFDGVDDGESIKATFKKRFLTAEHIFSAEEREDILEEARTIFGFNIAMVEELDVVVMSMKEKSINGRQVEGTLFAVTEYVRQILLILMEPQIYISLVFIIAILIVW